MLLQVRRLTSIGEGWLKPATRQNAIYVCLDASSSVHRAGTPQIAASRPLSRC